MEELHQILDTFLRDKTLEADMAKHAVAAAAATGMFYGAIHYGKILYERLTDAAHEANRVQQAAAAGLCTMALSAACETIDYLAWGHAVGGFETTDMTGDAIGAAAFVAGVYYLTTRKNTNPKGAPTSDQHISATKPNPKQ